MFSCTPGFDHLLSFVYLCLFLDHLVANCQHSWLQLSDVRECGFLAHVCILYPAQATVHLTKCSLNGARDRMRSPKGDQRETKYNREITSDGQEILSVSARRNKGFYVIKISPHSLPPDLFHSGLSS